MRLTLLKKKQMRLTKQVDFVRRGHVEVGVVMDRDPSGSSQNVKALNKL
jgi:hypothetical protein